MQRCSLEGVSSADDAIEKPRGRSLGISSSSRSGGTCVAAKQVECHTTHKHDRARGNST